MRPHINKVRRINNNLDSNDVMKSDDKKILKKISLKKAACITITLFFTLASLICTNNALAKKNRHLDERFRKTKRSALLSTGLSVKTGSLKASPNMSCPSMTTVLSRSGSDGGSLSIRIDTCKYTNYTTYTSSQGGGTGFVANLEPGDVFVEWDEDPGHGSNNDFTFSGGYRVSTPEGIQVSVSDNGVVYEVTSSGTLSKTDDGLNELDAVHLDKTCSMSLSINKYPLTPGDTATITAKTDFISDDSITWSLARQDGDANATITPYGNPATISDVSGEGWVKITAAGTCDSDDSTITKEALLYIGCTSCETGSCDLAGGGFVELSSIDVRLSLGKASEGTQAGDLLLKADNVSPDNATPAILKFNSLNNETEVIYDEGTIRQIVAHETFVDIVVQTAFHYDIRFYRPDALGNMADGVYEVIEGAVPFVTWTIEHPNESDYAHLTLREDKEGSVNEYDYLWDETLSTWSLSKGGGLQIKTKKEEIISGDRVVTDRVRDADGNIASSSKTIWQTFPWGEEVVEKIDDPEGEALTTTYTFVENENEDGYGKIESRVNADGSWVWYEYDASGRKITEISSWLDTPEGADASIARAFHYDYTPQDAMDSNLLSDERRPRKVTETILGEVVGLTYYVYNTDEITQDRTEIVEKCVNPGAIFGDSSNLRTTTVTHAYTGKTLESGKLKTITYPNGQLDSYTYEYGSYTPSSYGSSEPGTFVSGTGESDNYIRKTLIHGTIDFPDGIANKTTKEVTITDKLGYQHLRETHVYTGSTYERVGWVVNLFDDNGRIKETGYSNGTKTESFWGCCRKDYDIDTQGIVTSYLYDDLNRLQTKTKEKDSEYLNTEYGYDAAGRILTQSKIGGTLTQTQTTAYDNAGRVDYTIDSARLMTDYDYSDDLHITTVTKPGGITEITETYRDGRVKSITGSGVVATYYTYGVSSDGTQWTMVHKGALDAEIWEKTTVDMLGRTIKVEKPGYSGTETTQNIYDSYGQGQLKKTVSSAMAPFLYEYDSLGAVIKEGLDIDENNHLDGASSDRITAKDSFFERIDTIWFQTTTTKVFAKESDSTATTVSIQKKRLSEYGAGGLVSESLILDVNNNQTVTQIYIDRNAKKKTQIVDYPDAENNAVSETVNGLLSYTVSKTGVRQDYAYDELERQVGVTDSRTGLTTRHYDDHGRIDYMEDPALNRTYFVYDADTGRKIAQTNAKKQVTRFSYYDSGQIKQMWGDAATPIYYTYDAYNRLAEMHTYRKGTGWNSEIWPESSTGEADITTWHYHDATGLLEYKEDADGKKTTYTYTVGGKIETRTWARNADSDPIITTYFYDPSTAELTDIDYSDATPDITFSYNRLGKKDTITDAVGVRNIRYNESLQPEFENINGLYNKVITKTYDNETVMGRSTGFTIGADYTVTYGYEPDTGRFKSVSWGMVPEDHTDTFTYSYVPNSDLLNDIASIGGQKVTYGYEPKRNLRTIVKNEMNGRLISQYDYNYNEIGQRTSQQQSGFAFMGVINDTLLTSLPESYSDPLPEDYRHYTYDTIGNRETFTKGSQPPDSLVTTSIPNALNQYEQTVNTHETNTFTYDDDGNLTAITKGAGTTTYTYNAENRLIAISPETPESEDKKIEFTYDYQGRRVEKVVSVYESDVWQKQSHSRYVYNGWNLIQVLAETGEIKKQYLWGLDVSQSFQGAGGIGGLLASTDVSQSKMHYFFYDGNGNVGQLIDFDDDSIAAHYQYDPFGNITSAYGVYADTNSFRFSTKYHDDESGLVYYGYRYYSAELGRWINRDPINEEGGLNLYVFSNNNPIALIDPLGLKCNPDFTLPKFIFDSLKTALNNSYFSDGSFLEEGALIQFNVNNGEYTINWADMEDREPDSVVFPDIDNSQNTITTSNLHTHPDPDQDVSDGFSGNDILNLRDRNPEYKYLISKFGIYALIVNDKEKLENCPIGKKLDQFKGDVEKSLVDMMECCGICYYKGSLSDKNLKLYNVE